MILILAKKHVNKNQMQCQIKHVQHTLLLIFPALKMQFHTELLRHRCDEVNSEQRPFNSNSSVEIKFAARSTAFPALPGSSLEA